jgi:hypothetical protein
LHVIKKLQSSDIYQEWKAYSLGYTEIPKVFFTTHVPTMRLHFPLLHVAAMESQV